MTPPVGPPCELNVTPEGVMSASGWRCAWDSLCVMYVVRKSEAAVREIGALEMVRWGGRASGTIVEFYRAEL